ncbi:MAG: MFS transporter [Bacillaceae bacterium]
MNMLLKNKVFWIITLTDIIQFVGIWIRNIAILFFVMEMTNDSPKAVSAIHVIEMLPMLVFSFIGGIIADRFHPKKTMLLGDTLSMISFAIMGVLIAKMDWWIILFATFVSAIVSQFSYPSSAKYFKEYLPEDAVDRAVAFNQTLGSIFPIVGPALGTYFYYALGIQNVLFLIVVLYAASVITLLFLPKGNFQISKEKFSIWQDAKDSIRYIRKNVMLSVYIMAMSFLVFAMGLASTLDIFLVTERLGLAQQEYQFFAGVAGIGMIVGAVLYIAKAEWFRSQKAVVIMGCSLAITLFVEGMSTIVGLTLSLQFIDNALLGILSAYVMGIFTKETTQAYIGKVNGLISLLWYLGMVMATGIAGPLMEATHIVVVYGCAGVAMLIAVMIILANKQKLKSAQ